MNFVKGTACKNKWIRHFFICSRGAWVDLRKKKKKYVIEDVFAPAGRKDRGALSLFFSKIKIAANNSSKIFISCKKEAMQVL